MNSYSLFLMRAEQRILDHCARLLAASNLGADERRRLERLEREARATLAALSDSNAGDW
jgi:hypothetical protein